MQAIELQAHVTATHELHLTLPAHVGAGKVKVIVMYDNQISPEETLPKRVFGQFRNQLEIAQDFDAELPADFWLGSSE